MKMTVKCATCEYEVENIMLVHFCEGGLTIIYKDLDGEVHTTTYTGEVLAGQVIIR